MFGLVMFAMATILGQSAPGDVEVTISPSTVQTRVGDTAQIEVTVTNNGTDPTPALVAHIDITKPSRSGSVDPEDWTPTLSRGVGVLEPGYGTTLSWTLQPISGGRFSVYAVAISEANADVAVSSAIDFRVTEKRTLNPQGVLPVAIAAPLFVGALVVLRWRLRGRSRTAFS